MTLCPEKKGGIGGTLSVDGLDKYKCGKAIPPNTWHHLVLVKDSNAKGVTTNTIYVDGKVSSTSSANFGSARFDFDGSRPFQIGAYPGTTNFGSDISADEVSLFKRALTPTEILDHYRRGKAKLNISYRFCSDQDCNSNPVFSEYLVDSGTMYPPSAPINDTGKDYIQIRIDFEGDQLARAKIESIQIE